MKDYSKMSNEELILLLQNKDNELNNKDQELQAKQKELEEKAKELSDLIIELRDTREKLDAYIRKYEDKHQRLLKETYEKFVNKNETLAPKEKSINEAEATASTTKKGRKKGGKNFNNKLIPTRKITNDIPEDQRFCKACGEALVKIDEDRTIKIIKYPSTYEVVEIVTPVYACKNKNCENTTITQKLNEDVFPHSPITPSVAADIITLKYSLGVPLYRYAKHLNSQGIDLSSQDLSNYVIRTANLLETLYERLKYHLTHNNAQVLHVDETTLKVIEVEKKSKCYMFVYATTFYDNPIYVYEFSEDRTTDNTEKLFEDYKGYIVVDGYAGYNKFGESLLGIQRCMVHARRYFFDVVKTLTDEEKKKSKAVIVVKNFDAIFAYEAELKKSKCTIDEIVKHRNSEEYKKLITNLEDSIKSINPEPKSLLDKAINYSLNAWSELFTYLNYGYLEPSNNVALSLKSYYPQLFINPFIYKEFFYNCWG